MASVDAPGTADRPLTWGLRLAAVLAALLAVRLIALHFNRTDLFFDEAQYWSWSLEPAFGYYSKPPLIAWVIRIATDSCGLSEFCIRLPAPLIHTATAAIIFLTANTIYGPRAAFWAGLAYATLPGVSLSSGIISTDVPLLLFWALALFALVNMFRGRAWWPALVMGVALGLGLNAKYAMAYFLLCLAVYLVATPERRWLLRDPRLWLALVIGAALIAPNLIWNAGNSFATFSHTADNAKWTGSLVNPGKALEFFGAQFGVFGPILFASLLVIAWRAWRDGLPEQDRLLLAFALPVVIVITVQAFLSRAHANWAAVSYIAATILVTGVMVRDLSGAWLRASLGIHVAILAVIAVATANAGTFRLPGAGDPFARTLGWREVAAATRSTLEKARAAGAPFASVMTDDRAITAELLYYMQGEPTPVFAWRGRGRPQDHYELTRAFTSGSPEPVLLVSVRRDAGEITSRFARAEVVAREALPAGLGPKRNVTFWRLSGLRP